MNLESKELPFFVECPKCRRTIHIDANNCKSYDLKSVKCLKCQKDSKENKNAERVVSILFILGGIYFIALALHGYFIVGQINSTKISLLTGTLLLILTGLSMFFSAWLVQHEVEE